MTTDLRALLEKATAPDGLLHADDCLFAQDVGPCSCGRADARTRYHKALRNATLRLRRAQQALDAHLEADQ